jgi:serine/threonine-protein kinase
MEMSGSPDPNLPPAGPRPDDVDRQFEEAWQHALLGGPRPMIDEFLTRAADTDRPALRAVLEPINTDYQRRLARLCSIEAVGVLDYDTDAGAGGGTIGYQELPAVDANATIAPTGETSPEQTIGFDPAATIDPSPDAGDRNTSLTDADKLLKRRPGPESIVIPGYEVLGVLGRGGMGVVYKARHLRLKRTVALKMVLAGAHAGPQDLARFFIEAEAIAQLQHPNIVQVYEIGDHDGLPFFALEYLDGGSLGGKLDGKPQRPRDAARLAETLARAMAYAHLHGIVHRDLKPGNILLTGDGQPKITDFGLAKRLEGDSSQTKSGTLMGTPNYMAPEQARGDTKGAGPLADVYSLGVILYEMLTGRTPFVGTSIMDTLRLVQNQEAVAPRRLQPTVPADLDTITLKCLQKDPAKRYASADALADDLRRFLGDQPIMARPVGAVERTWRWCRRNPKVAGLSAAVLLLLVTVAITSTVMAVRISAEHAAAVTARDEAVAARELADQNAGAEKTARELADQQAALALKTIQSLITQVVQVQLGDEPRTQRLKIGLLQTALKGLEQASQRAEGLTGTSIQATMASAYTNMGLVFKQLGETEEAFRCFARGHEIIQARAAAQPNRDAAQGNLATTFVLLGDMSQELRRDMAAALGYYRQALAIREELHRHPHGGEGRLDPLAVKVALAEAHSRVGVTLLRLGDPAGALEPLQRSLAFRRELADAFRWNLAEAAPGDEKIRTALEKTDEILQQELGRAYNALGEVGSLSRDPVAARTYYAKCLRIREALLQAHPDSRAAKREYAATSGNFGDICVRSGDPEAARPPYERSLALFRALADADPQNADARRDLATALYRVATVCQMVNDASGAAERFGECLRIREDLASKDTKNNRRQAELMRALPHVGQHARAATIAETLRSGKPDAELLLDIACGYALCADAVVKGRGPEEPSPDEQARRDRYLAAAVKALKDTVAQGYTDAVTLETEPDLRALRSDPTFQGLLSEVRKAAEARQGKARELSAK